MATSPHPASATSKGAIYESTRGNAPELGFCDAVMAGLAADGGLYVPKTIKRFGADEWAAFAGLSFPELAVRLLAPFTEPDISKDELEAICAAAWGSFDHPAITPIKQIDTGLYLLELFHGPTLAFKDVALQWLGQIFSHILEQKSDRMTVIGATSGDTGSAAISGLRGLPAVDVFILYPYGRTSEVQRRQMTTVQDANVHALAVEGTFDDCQAIIKTLFQDEEFRRTHHPSAVNSINWARIAAQTVYYAYAALQLGAPEREVVFSVPSANFGNILAGHYAKAMGLPIRSLICASNQNDILHRFFETGQLHRTDVQPSLSPSMDIQISSNFERLLFEAVGRNGDELGKLMADFQQTGLIQIDREKFQQAFPWFTSGRCDDRETLKVMASEYAVSHEIIDPHTAVGLSAARHKKQLFSGTPIVSLACAHPAKFPNAVDRAIGRQPDVPDTLKHMMAAPERAPRVAASADAVKLYIEKATA